MVEVTSNNRDRQSCSQHAGNGADAAHKVSQPGGRHEIAIPHRGHGDDAPPEADGDVHELVLHVELGKVDAGGEDEHAHKDEQYEQEQLAQTGPGGQLEDLESPVAFGHLKEAKHPEDTGY